MTTKSTLATGTSLGTPGGDYAALLAELDTFSKAMGGDEGSTDPDADKKIAAAGDEAGAKKVGEEGGSGESGEDDEEEDPFTKSMQVTLPDGTEVEAFDGTAMLKALRADNLALREENAALQSRVTVAEANGDALLKSMNVMLGTMKALQSGGQKQDDVIKSLQADVARIGGQGTGRKAVVSVHDKPAGGAPQPDGISPREFMVKAMAAHGRGHLTAIDIARAESFLGHGLQLPADLVAAVAASEAKA